MSEGDNAVRDHMKKVRDDREQFRLDQAKRLTEENLDANGDIGPRHVPEFSGQPVPVEQLLDADDFAVMKLDDPDGPEAFAGTLMDGLEDEPTPETLPTDAQARKDIPLVTGLLDYFPAALAEVAKVSKAGNDKHNPGEPLHWARDKSMDQADCIGRHLLERGGFDPETGQRHSAQMAWRALALLQLELEEDGAPMARGAK